MNKKLNLKFELENGKNGNFSISNIKEVSTDDASNYVKAVDFNEIFEIKGQKVTKITEAKFVTTSTEQITID